MTLPEELVKAAAEAPCLVDGTRRCSYVDPRGFGHGGLVHPECAVVAVLRALPGPMKAEVTGNDDDRLRAEGWNDCLAALAKLAEERPTP